PPLTLHSSSTRRSSDLVLQTAQVSPTEFLDPTDPIAQRVDVYMHGCGATLPGSRVGEELFERGHQLRAVFTVVGQKGAQQSVPVGGLHFLGHRGQKQLVG